MSVASISSASNLYQHSATQQRVDRNGGADKAQELGKSNSPSVRVQVSERAQQMLAASIANDADHGRDGK